MHMYFRDQVRTREKYACFGVTELTCAVASHASAACDRTAKCLGVVRMHADLSYTGPAVLYSASAGSAITLSIACRAIAFR